MLALGLLPNSVLMVFRRVHKKQKLNFSLPCAVAKPEIREAYRLQKDVFQNSPRLLLKEKESGFGKFNLSLHHSSSGWKNEQSRALVLDACTVAENAGRERYFLG